MDKKVISILKKSSERDHTPDKRERELLRQNGVLWEKTPMTHDELIAEIRAAADKTAIDKAARGFLYSISSGDHRYRTALSSLIWAKALSAHEYEKSKTWLDTYECRVCGGEFSPENDLAVFSETNEHYVRLVPQKKFTDICRASYVLCDLEYFAELPDVAHRDEDIRILNRIFGLASELSPANKVNALLKNISADERLSLSAADAYMVLGVLSSCGGFDTPDRKSYRSGFVKCSDRDFEYETDIYYPLVHWRAKYGINYGAIADVFGKDIADKISPETAIKGGAVRAKKARSKGSGAERYFRDGEHLIEMNDRYRHYYGLRPLDPKWDKVVMYSVTHSFYKRTEIYFEGNTIRKYIYEEKLDSISGGLYKECDTETETENREMILPKTARGRKQPLTPSMLQTSAYMNEYITVILAENGGSISSCNVRSGQRLSLPPVSSLRSNEEFAEYTEEYIAACPPGYDDILADFTAHKRGSRR